MNARVLFFVGKGGVGKSTNSSLFALKLARGGKRVLLNSIDPAHNLHDIFKISLGPKPKQIVPGLEAMETDLDQWLRIQISGSLQSAQILQNSQVLPRAGGVCGAARSGRHAAPVRRQGFHRF
jgi:anion-transporting  ArsA/GET3 family ATPase